jgi:hypothetical protein
MKDERATVPMAGRPLRSIPPKERLTGVRGRDLCCSIPRRSEQAPFKSFGLVADDGALGADFLDASHERGPVLQRLGLA